jgi:hypothetical protein
MSELWLKFKDEDGYDQRIRVEGDEFTVGRHSSNDLCVPNSKLSREHIKIEHVDEGFLVSDSGSTNGTTLNGEDLRDPIALKDCDKLDLGGGVAIEIELTDTAGNADAPSEFDAEAGSGEPPAGVDGGMEAGNEVAAAPYVGEPAASESGIPTSVFFIAPVLGLFILILLGAIIYLVSSGDTTKASGNDFVYTENDDPANDRPSKHKSTVDPPSNTTTPNKKDDPPPGNTGSTNTSGDGGTTTLITTTKDPTSDVGKCELNGATFMRRIAQNEPKAFLTGEQAQIVSGKVKQLGGSSALADNINSARKSAAQIKALAVSKNLKPQFLATAALAKLGTSKGDALQTAQGMADILDHLGTQIGSELANDCLLMIAVYDQGAAGDFMKMRNMLQDLATKSPESARAIRSIWFLHKNGKITDAEYDFALRFLAIGTITQNPKDFGVNTDALVL